MRSFRLACYSLIVVTLTACGVNPVTGKKEIQFVSEATELKMGEVGFGFATAVPGAGPGRMVSPTPMVM